MTLSNPDEFYIARAGALRESARRLRARAHVITNARIATFLLFILCGVGAELGTPILWLPAVIAAIGFLVLVARHRRYRAEIRELEARAGLCDLGLARRKRQWSELPVVIPAETPPHPYAHDLDLLGERAVTQLFGPVRTHHGRAALRGWLTAPSAIPEVRERQDSTRILAGDVDFRESLAIEGASLDAHSDARLTTFLKWLGTPIRTALPPALLEVVRFLPLVTIALIGAQLAGLTDQPWWVLPFITSAILSFATLRGAHAILDAAFSTQPAPLQYSKLMAVAERTPATTPQLKRIHNRVHSASSTASKSIRRLEQIMTFSDARHSPGIMSILLETFFLWSLQSLIALRAWQKTHGDSVAGWFSALGELEALSSIATLAHDQPAWSYPELDADARTIEATAIGHPLLSDDVRVHNDVTVGPPATLLLVTGSNMSGKSTLLRSIGVNTVLAQAGAPVCATSYRAPVLHLVTSINVHDSLTAGVSLYMAQLQRLKEVLDAARNATPQEPCCYLLDEILSGTNSADRTIAVRAVLHRLLKSNAIGVVTTHDLAVAADERIQRAAVNVHFADTIDSERGSMTFDYRVKPGPVETSNALELMRMMGIS